EPLAGNRLDGTLRTRGPRRGESAPPLRADARRLGRALRCQLGGDPRARPGALRRALPPHLAHVSVVVRGDVPLEAQPHTSVPGHRENGERSGRRVTDVARGY